MKPGNVKHNIKNTLTTLYFILGDLLGGAKLGDGGWGEHLS